jgi:hypothetical protein
MGRGLIFTTAVEAAISPLRWAFLLKNMVAIAKDPAVKYTSKIRKLQRIKKEGKTDSLAEVYFKTIAEKQKFERKFMADELTRNWIIPLLTTPENLTIDVVNKYVDIKARKMI